ncbi:uncharacterized protein LOC111696834 [Eurytemora carolleeae]|uniref:uncharacterized protein LOC111696834 n=1 Tax=Eurytemora carolleeae TaxID=1294199 RepID=UPI000C788ADB|nr:uncharacterized protein LOC111696834 [Eurytemora carolleeae]|eukprot:XP_023322351.1 uncharacterized protein LOC111696834 [Eurytemora affinis]
MAILTHILIFALTSQAVVFAQDNYGTPESPLLRPSANLRFSPGFSSTLGSSAGFSSSSGLSSGFSPSLGSSSGFSSSVGSSSGFSSSAGTSSNNIFIEDFSPISSPGSSPSSVSLSNSLTSSTFSQASGTPPTTTSASRSAINPSRFNPVSDPQPSFARQTSSRLPALPAASANTGDITGGIDFSKATRTPDGRLCVIKEESVETVSKDPILACTHKNLEKCHYTYVTYFRPAQEEVCEENFEKRCQITFRQEATKETIRKCYKPQEKVCNGQGEEECRTVYESSCSTKYIEKTPGKFIGDTSCEKLPVEICGRGCVNREGAEECHNKEIDTLVDIPEEVCDLNPQKTCRLQTKLVPSLKPKQECTTVPQETCTLNFSQPKRGKKPLRTEWCLDTETAAAADPIAQYSRNGNQF